MRSRLQRCCWLSCEVKFAADVLFAASLESCFLLFVPFLVILHFCELISGCVMLALDSLGLPVTVQRHTCEVNW